MAWTEPKPSRRRTTPGEVIRTLAELDVELAGGYGLVYLRRRHMPAAFVIGMTYRTIMLFLNAGAFRRADRVVG